MEAASGEYPVTSPEEKDKVTLTAKAIKGTFTKERTFTVIVHKEESTLTAEELIKSINLPTETEVDISLPVEIDGVSGTGITWTSGSEQTIHIEKSLHKAVITRELGDVPVKLTAKLTYNSSMVEKEFTVTVKRITKITATKSYTENGHHTVHTAYTLPMQPLRMKTIRRTLYGKAALTILSPILIYRRIRLRHSKPIHAMATDGGLK